MASSLTVDNVAVVVIDALRADRVGAYGSDRGLTPRLDALARNATVFDRAFACVNTTDPSITSLHTGKQPRSTVIHHGGLVTDIEKRRVEAVEYVPERLSDAGVKTVATGRVMGRWHTRGFEEYAWSRVGATEVKLSKVLQRVHPLVHRVASGCYNAVADWIKQATADEADPIDDLLAQTGSDPYYGFVHLMDTHAWYDADEALVDELLDDHDYPNGDLRTFFDEYSDSPVVTKLLEPNAKEADYDVGIARLCARYDASVREADRKLGRLIDGLQARGDWDDTALFVLSDHGESLHEHGIYFDHHGLYDQSIRIPLIVHVPGTEPNRVDDFVQIHDLASTILDLFEMEGPANADGQSILGYLSPDRESPETRDAVMIEEAHTQRRRGLRTARYKFIEHVKDDRVAEFWDTDSLMCGYCQRQHGDEVELYDLRTDPRETRNLATDRPDLVDDLRERMAENIDSLFEVTIGDDSIAYEDEQEVLEHLEELGYR